MLHVQILFFLWSLNLLLCDNPVAVAVAVIIAKGSYSVAGKTMNTLNISGMLLLPKYKADQA